MRKLICIYSLLFVLFFAVDTSNAADLAVQVVQKRYSGLKSMRAEFVQTLTHTQSGKVETRNGVLSFAKPMNVRWEITSPIPEVQLVTPEAIWNAFPDEDMAYKYAPSLPPELTTVVNLLTGQSELDKDFDIENAGVQTGLAKLMLYPKAAKSNSMNSAELMVDVKTGEIKSVTIVDFFHNRNAMVFSSQSLDPQLPASLFTFTPAKGMKVEDKTKNDTAGKPLLQ